MISLDPASMSEKDNYKFLIGSIIPRPIALVTTLSNQGILNAAPFSYFNIVCANPPMISVSVQRRNGEQKDTARNAVGKGQFVVHITDETNVEAANDTAVEFPPDKSELEKANFTAVPSTKVDVPGLNEAKVRMECVLERVIPLGGTEQAPACDLLIGKIVQYHIDENIYSEGRIDPHGLKAVSRLAGNSYAKLGDMFDIERPVK